MKILLVGNIGGTNVAQSFFNSATKLGYQCQFLNIKDSQSQIRIVNSIFWKIFSKRFPFEIFFNQKVLSTVETFCPQLVLTTGHNPIKFSTLKKIRKGGVFTVHFSTDDPWNKKQRAKWFLNSLLGYDVIFTPRISNILDFKTLGCQSVRYLPFAYDEDIFGNIYDMNYLNKDIDVLYVGGGDEDRRYFFSKLKLLGINFLLVGSYWNNYPELFGNTIGNQTPEEVINLTLRAKINLCMVRKANRDGHVMRTFEMAAIGASMLVEETEEHKDLFGPEKNMVYYFNSPENAAEKIKILLRNSGELIRILEISKRRIFGIETYTNRLLQILNEVK